MEESVLSWPPALEQSVDSWGCAVQWMQSCEGAATVPWHEFADVLGRTYNRIQKVYLIPSVIETWDSHQMDIIRAAVGKVLTLGGDARCDSPGYSAKYSSYSLIDLDTSKIMDIQLVQVCIQCDTCVLCNKTEGKNVFCSKLSAPNIIFVLYKYKIKKTNLVKNIVLHCSQTFL
jgi:hypothetical protein